jgi:hypothetical protein
MRRLGNRDQSAASQSLLKPSNRPLLRYCSFWMGMLGAATMLDTDAIVTTGPRPSTFDRLPPSFGDPDQTDLDRLAASLDYLALSSCEPATDNANQQPPAAAIAEPERL